eukprot:GDKI01026594.1.p1 GENE.GDKI01026594.1~~GDKI01026594.1.p1  ORF type:complete len:107 (-),score=23.52 GDKI01026594.1:92-412(-)
MSLLGRPPTVCVLGRKKGEEAWCSLSVSVCGLPPIHTRDDATHMTDTTGTQPISGDMVQHVFRLSRTCLRLVCAGRGWGSYLSPTHARTWSQKHVKPNTHTPAHYQ